MSSGSGATTERFRYHAAGLLIRTDVELSFPTADEDVGVDVDVRRGPDLGCAADPPLGEVVAAHDLTGEWWYVAVSDDDGYVIRFRGCGEFWISPALDVIELRADPAGRPELLPILLAGTVLSFLLTLRGQTVLHASGVAFDGQAVALIGHSGHGKSTIAALLCSRGADLVTDDVLVVDPEPRPTCVGGSTEFRLRERSASIAEQLPDATVRLTADGRHAIRPNRSTVGRVPLRGIIVPRRSRSATLVERRVLRPTQALYAMLACPRVHGWRDHAVITRDFSTLSKLSNTVPVIEVTVPWGPPFRDDVVDQLLAFARPPFGAAEQQ